MCGITGIVQSNIGNNQKYHKLLKIMTDKIVHRGPDSEGYEFFNDCILGFRRLAIIDTTTNGNQPMFSTDKIQCIVFNGEIYNYKELKKDLNYNFSNSTDTEVLLALFNNSDPEYLNQLNGMFAFALWNEEKKELFCARDRFGQKPFFYAIGKNGEFIFGSEIKSILSTNLVSKEINIEALAHYLKYSHLHPEQSIYKNINILPPASYLILKDNQITINKYWSVDLVQKNNNISEKNAINNIQKIAKDAVKKQLNSDVTVGAFLSGGYDSGTIVALSSKFHPNINTIAFGYQNQLNELPLAKEIASKYNTNHTEVQVDLNTLGELVEEIYSKLDEPISDSSIPASYLINKEARKRMTVVLSGNAGDELFGGYNWYNKEFSILTDKKYNLNLLKLANLATKKLKLNSLNYTLNNLIIAAKYSSITEYHKENVQIFLNNNDLKKILPNIKDFEYKFPFTLDDSDLNTCLKMDLYKTLSGSYLVKDDRVSMLNSIEIRIPFLDNNLVDYVIGLNYKYKVDGINKKKIFKKCFGNLLTENILAKKKQGFGAPVTSWLKQQQLENLTSDILKNKKSKLYDYLDFENTQSLLNYDYKHWNLLILGIWMKANL